MDITPQSRVGEIATKHPMATKVFSRHGIDFCCGGGVTLGEACAKQGIQSLRVLEEIEQTLEELEPGTVSERWDRAPVSDLVHHIINSYHEPLREELPRLESMTRKVVRVHGHSHPERFGELLETFLRLKTELETHLTDEEEILFPALLRQAAGPSAGVAPFIDDHTRVGLELARLSELTNDYSVPEGACATWNALWHGLSALDHSLREHIHLENNVLFPQFESIATLG